MSFSLPVTEVTSRRRQSLRDCWTTRMEQSPEFVTDCSSPLTFKKYLKTYQFSLSF